MTIGINVVLAINQRVRGSPHDPPLVREEYIPVAAKRRVSRPFVTWKRDKATVFIKMCRDIVEILPEDFGHLKVIALVGADIEKRFVTPKGKIINSAIGAQCLFGLPVQITPVFPQMGLFRDTAGITAGDDVALRIAQNNI